MTRRVLNPKSIRDFSRDLCIFSRQVNDGIHTLRAQLEALGNAEWQDHTQREYTDEFEDAVRAVQAAITRFEQDQSRRLADLAQQAEDVRY